MLDGVETVRLANVRKSNFKLVFTYIGLLPYPYFSELVNEPFEEHKEERDNSRVGDTTPADADYGHVRGEDAEKRNEKRKKKKQKKGTTRGAPNLVL